MVSELDYKRKWRYYERIHFLVQQCFLRWFPCNMIPGTGSLRPRYTSPGNFPFQSHCAIVQAVAYWFDGWRAHQNFQHVDQWVWHSTTMLEWRMGMGSGGGGSGTGFAWGEVEWLFFGRMWNPGFSKWRHKLILVALIAFIHWLADLCSNNCFQ